MQINYTLDVCVRVSVRVRDRVMIRVRAKVRVRVSVRVMARVKFKARTEWATDESPKHPMAAYVWVNFKSKYSGYIFGGIFCPVHFVWYMFLFCKYCSVCFVLIYFVRVYFVAIYLCDYNYSGWSRKKSSPGMTSFNNGRLKSLFANFKTTFLRNY